MMALRLHVARQGAGGAGKGVREGAGAAGRCLRCARTMKHSELFCGHVLANEHAPQRALRLVSVDDQRDAALAEDVLQKKGRGRCDPWRGDPSQAPFWAHS